jgi:hypothetical protein
VAAARECLLARVGNRLHCLAGVPAVEPAAPPRVEVPASAALSAIPEGLPVWPIAIAALPTNWLAAAPLPGRDLDSDWTADQDLRAKGPKIGGVVRLGTNAAVFAATGVAQVFRFGKTAALDVTAVHRRIWNTTGVFALAVKNDRDRLVRLTTAVPEAANWRMDLGTRLCLGGVEVGADSIVRLPAGVYALTIRTSMGQCDEWGKIIMRPSFVECDEAAARAAARHAELAANHEGAMSTQRLDP